METDEAGKPLNLLYGAVEEERKQSEGFPLRYGFRKWRPGQRRWPTACA